MAIEIRNHPNLFSLSAQETVDLLTDLTSAAGDAGHLVARATENGFARAPIGKWYVQVDHAGDSKFLVSIQGKRTNFANREIR